MTVSNISSTIAGLLQQMQGSQTASSSPATTASTSQTASSGQGSDPAYQLSLGQQQITSDLLGYGQLGALVRQTGDTLSALAQGGLAAELPVDGSGQLLTEDHSIDVQQLAQAQTLSTAGLPDADTTSLGTGTLTIQFGSQDSSTGSFTAGGTPVTVAITDGSLNGIAAAINGANAGVTASVAQGADGQYRLQLTGPTGAANAFALSGIDALSYDPSASFSAGLTATTTATDANYSVDGGASQTSASNTVTVAGTSTTLTATGTTTVSAPFGQAQTAQAAQTLVDSVNALISGANQLTGSGGTLTGDTGIASAIGASLDQVLQQSLPGVGGTSTLAGIGITVQADGTLSVDSNKLAQSYASDPTGTRTVLDAATTAAQKALAGSDGAGSGIQAQLQSFAQLLTQGTSLTDLLGQSSDGSSSDPFANMMDSGTINNELLSLLQPTSSTPAQSTPGTPAAG